MKTLVFTIATNGYEEFLAEHIDSQRRYAARHGYEHVALTKNPPWGITAANSAWLKIPMMLHYLRSGDDRVLWIDADARPDPADAPPLAARPLVCAGLSRRLTPVSHRPNGHPVAFFRPP
jgi:hypothetical protein